MGMGSRGGQTLFYENNADDAKQEEEKWAGKERRRNNRGHLSFSVCVCGMIPLVAGTVSSLYDYWPWSV